MLLRGRRTRTADLASITPPTMCEQGDRAVGMRRWIAVATMVGFVVGATPPVRANDLLPGVDVVAFDALEGYVDADTRRDSEVYRVDTDGRDLTRLTDDGIDQLGSAWSPDGQRLLVRRQGGPGVIDLQGELLATTPSSDGDWSPDGLSIAFGVEEAAVVQDLRTGASRTVFSAPDEPGFGPSSVSVDWAPRGDLILVGVQYLGGSDDLLHRTWVVAADGSAAVETDGWGWMPDGASLWSIDADGLAVRPARGDDDVRVLVPNVVAPPVFSPDGGRLAYWTPSDGVSAGFEGTRVYDLWTALIDGTQRRQHLRGVPTMDGLAWSPDGQRLALAGQLEADAPETSLGDLFVLDLATDAIDQITATPDLDEENVQWAGASNSLVYSVTQLSDGNEGLLLREDTYRIDPDGTNALRLPNPGDDADWDGVRPRPRTILPTVAPSRFGIVRRVAGSDRIATAIAASRRAFDDAPAVVLARADAYPDALAGASLATAAGGPLLLTASETLDERVTAEITRLGATTAFLLGTDAVMSADVAATLRGQGLQVRRFGGADRYATAAAVAEELGGDEVYLVRGSDPDPGRGWADAVAVAALAAHQQVPVLFTSPTDVPGATRQALNRLGTQRVTIVGGPAAVPTHIADDLRDDGLPVGRLAGDDRYGTSTLVADAAVAAGMDPSRVVAVTGRNWPDALAAGPFTAEVGGVTLLVDPNSVAFSGPAGEWLHDHSDSVSDVVVLGGLAAVDVETTVDVNRRLGHGFDR